MLKWNLLEAFHKAKTGINLKWRHSALKKMKKISAASSFLFTLCSAAFLSTRGHHCVAMEKEPSWMLIRCLLLLPLPPTSIFSRSIILLRFYNHVNIVILFLEIITYPQLWNAVNLSPHRCMFAPTSANLHQEHLYYRKSEERLVTVSYFKAQHETLSCFLCISWRRKLKPFHVLLPLSALHFFEWIKQMFRR